MARYMADFETTTDVNDCRVWASAIVDIDRVYEENYGGSLHVWNDIDGLFSFLKSLDGEHQCFFHNLKFDGMFILDKLIRDYGFTHDDKLETENTISCMISEMGAFYQIRVRFNDKPLLTKTGKQKMKKGQPVTIPTIIAFRDSLKKIPLSASQIAKAYDLEESKLEIDYKAKRDLGHELTLEEREYIVADIVIVAKALHQLFSEGMEKLTMSSDALNDFKLRLAHQDEKSKEDVFRVFFPEITVEMDKFIRKAYKGGYTYTNPKFANQIHHQGLVYDVNSLYPSQMQQKPLPYGFPVPYTGLYQSNENYPLFIQSLECEFHLKDGYLPTVQIKNNARFRQTEYLSESDGVVELTMTCVDLSIFLEHYHVKNVRWIGGFMFKQHVGFFEEYINYWGEVKKNSTGGKRQLAKLMLNSLYGKFASSTDNLNKVPYLDEKGVINFVVVQDEDRKPVYTPLACFVTAHARDVMIRSAQSCYDRFAYCDTDSLHILGYDIPTIDIDPKRLGAWKCEGVFNKAKYVRAKTYIEDFLIIDGKAIETPLDINKCNGTHMEVKCCGMPESSKVHVSYDNFKVGSVFPDKLMPRRVKGGIVLVETNFSIN